MCHYRQTGAALLVALMVVALSTLLATRLLVTQDHFVGLAQTERNILQARQLARAGLDWGRSILLDDMMSGSVDHSSEPWAHLVPEIEAEGGKISGHLRDAQSRFNINNLIGREPAIDRDMVTAYTRILRAANVDPALGPALAEWMLDTNQKLIKAKRSGTTTGRRLWFSLADLANVSGYTPEVIEQMRSHLIALPMRTPINVNSADAIVLVAADLSLDEAIKVVALRRRNYFHDAADFISRANPGDPPNGIITAQSIFFEATVAAQFGDARLKNTTLLQRKPGFGRVDVIAVRDASE